MFLGKKISKKTFLIGLGFLVWNVFVLANKKVALAAYQLHEKIPGQENISTLQEYLEGLYKFGIAIVAILAVVMVAVGAFMYIVTSAGNAGKLANAKEIITNALIGLIMALLAWLILFVINPDLVGTSLNMEVPEYVDWVGDQGQDHMCDNPSANLYEKEACKGDKICLGRRCIYKKQVCDSVAAPIGGYICDGNTLAPPGTGECGPQVAPPLDGFMGSCTPGGIYVCPADHPLISDGKQCSNSVCCSK